MNFACRQGIEMIFIPPHNSQWLQSFDWTFFGPLKTYYGQEADKWMVNYPRQQITEFEVAKLFKGAYEHAAVLQNCSSGFCSTEISPFNPSIFSDNDLLQYLLLRYQLRFQIVGIYAIVC